MFSQFQITLFLVLTKMETVITNIPLWLEQEKHNFMPPVCNKLLHSDGYLKVFFVGGPNVRKDFHIEEGEEFFYMLKGDMCLRVVEQDAFKDIHIKEGEVFLLPGRIPHSPQRKADTFGLVIERERKLDEIDGLRYFVNDTTDILFERWFYCDDLGGKLSAIVKDFFNSEAYRTGKPQNEQRLVAPYDIDHRRSLGKPFSLKEWISAHGSEICRPGGLSLFGTEHPSQISVMGQGLHSGEPAETFVWQMEGKSDLSLDGDTSALKPMTSALIPAGKRWTLENEPDAVTLVVRMG